MVTKNAKTSNPVNSKSKARKTSNPSTADRKKAAGLDKMSDILFEKFEVIRDLQNKLNMKEAESKYQIGSHVAEVMKMENAYGARSVDRLTAALRHHQSTLRHYARVADTWELKKFKALMKRKGKRGVTISFSHLNLISQIEDSLERDKWIDRVLKDGLSVRELNKKRAAEVNEIPAVVDKQVSNCGVGIEIENEVDHGQQDVVEEKKVAAAASSNPMRQSIARLNSDVKVISAQAREWDARVFEPLKSEPSKLDDAVRDELRETSASAKAAIKVLRDRNKQIGELLGKAGRSEKSSQAGSVKEGGEQDG